MLCNVFIPKVYNGAKSWKHPLSDLFWGEFLARSCGKLVPEAQQWLFLPC